MFRSEYAENRFLDAFERIASALEKQVPVAPPVQVRTETFDDIRRLYLNGQKIEAIKLFRTLTGAGLKDAKDQVEAIRQF
jgi:ribosomal protein L7/L12